MQTQFQYDGFGQLVQESKIQDGQTAQTGYAYDSIGRLEQLTHPSGRTVTYQRDSLGRIERIDTVLNAQAQTVVEQIRYRADNQLESLRYGNGSEERRQYNGLGRLIQRTLIDSNGQTIQEQSYQYDTGGNLTKRQTQGLSQFPQLTARYQYDSLDRLTSESYDLYPERNAVYTFDANGNRLTKLQGQAETEISEIYRYQPNSNRMVDRDVLRQDNPPQEPIKDIEYDAKQRIRKLYVDGKLKAEYRYDARNLRTKKTLYDASGNVTETIYYHYDSSGLLIGESDGQGQAKRDYVYLDGAPLAQIDIDNQGQESIVYLHTDHLATPRLATNANQTVVWKWESDAYGAIAPQGSMTINLRNPGQYADQESGWFYNWNRYYDSGRGRYLTSDPIGLRGGLNTFIYAEGRPTNNIDPAGLYVSLVCRPVALFGSLGLSKPKHCAVIVWHIEPRKNGCCEKNVLVIDAQYSLPGGRTAPFDPNNKDNSTADVQTYLDDRKAFFDFSGGDTSNFLVPPPSGMSQEDFDKGVCQVGDSYKQGKYGLPPFF